MKSHAFSERRYQTVHSSTVVFVFSQNFNKTMISLEPEPQINCQQLPRTGVSVSGPPCVVDTFFRSWKQSKGISVSLRSIPCCYTIQVHWCAALFCCTTPEQTKILQNALNSRVFDGLGESSEPPHPYFGARESKENWNLSKVLYRQVHWCAALFFRTSPEQAKIPQNRPNVRVFDICGHNSGRRTPPPLIWGCRNQKNRSFLAKNPFLSTF